MRIPLSLSALFLIALSCSTAAAQNCFGYGPTVTLTGKLHSRVFPGPPNYESIRQGDRKETALLLTLVKEICTTGSDPLGIDVPEANLRDIQLVITNDAHWKVVHRLMGKRVIVTGTLFHAHTGHHITKVLAEVTSMRAAG